MNIIEIDHSSVLYDRALEVWNQVWPKYAEEREEWSHYDKNYDPKYFYQRFVLVQNDIVAATGIVCEPWWSFKPGKLHFELSVIEDHRRQGMGRECLKYIDEQLRILKGEKLTTHTKEDHQEAVRFLKNRGFAVVLREPESKLDVNNFNFRKFDNIQKKIQGSGIRLKPLAELQKCDTEWKPKLYKLYCAIMTDVPSNDDNTDRTFENFEKQKLNALGFDSRANFIAIDNDQYVGLSSLWHQLRKPKIFWTDLTGVLRSHRRRNIATALKLCTISYAIQQGVDYIKTDNEENNPMFKINKRLGFTTLPAWLTLEKHY